MNLNNKNIDVSPNNEDGTIEMLENGKPIYSVKSTFWRKHEIYDSKYEPAGLIFEFKSFGKTIYRFFTKTGVFGNCVSINTALEAMKLPDNRKSYYRKEICGEK